MRSFAFGLIASALAIAAAVPAHAQAYVPPPPYLQPEFPNYLSPPGAARCAWYDDCWYLIRRGPPVAVTAAAPIVPLVRKPPKRR